MAVAESDAAVLALLEPLTSPIVLTEGRNLFLGPMLPPNAGGPQKAVWVVPTGQRRDAVFVYESVQVTIRSDAADYAGGLALARACEVALHCPTVPTGWTDVQVNNGPYYVARQGEGRHVWSLNVTMCRALRAV